MKHLIIGKGNLGSSLEQVFTRLNHNVLVLTQSNGFLWPYSKGQILKFDPDYIWLCAGAGSIEQCKANPRFAIETHVTMPYEIMKAVKASTRVAIFSSDYAADENDPSNSDHINFAPRSFYALTKVWIEQSIRLDRRPLTTVFRVSNLYGHLIPEKTFSGKLMAKYPKPCHVSLPINWIVPTPTWWVADVISKNLPKCFSSNGSIVHHVSPAGGTTVLEFGRQILGDKYTFTSNGLDQERPPMSRLGCTIERPPSWMELWEQHQRQDATGVHLDEYRQQRLDEHLPGVL